MPGALAALVVAILFLVSGLKVLREYERAVVFRLGRLVGARGPGIIYIIPGIEKAVRIDLRTITMGQVALKLLDRPEEMRRAMARQAEAERERRAKVIAAEGEFQAAQRLAEASAIMAREPIALQLRYLQTLVEVASENNSTTIFPIPIDILRPFILGAQAKEP